MPLISILLGVTVAAFLYRRIWRLTSGERDILSLIGWATAIPLMVEIAFMVIGHPHAGLTIASILWSIPLIVGGGIAFWSPIAEGRSPGGDSFPIQAVALIAGFAGFGLLLTSIFPHF